MSGDRVFISTAPFGDPDPTPLMLLEEAGVPYERNPYGRRLREEELADHIRDARVLIAGTEPITDAVLAKAPRLGLIARVGIGLDNVDLLAARRRGIAVSYTPDAPAPAVAELTLGLILAGLRFIPHADRAMRAGCWERMLGRRLAACTVGVIGVGRVGKRVIGLLEPFGCPVLANDIEPDLAFGERYRVRWATKEEIYESCDVITLHVPLTAQTRHLIDARALARMKPDAVLVNTARGEIVDEVALSEALAQGRLGIAALDVFGREPYDGPLVASPRCILTCHMGSMTVDCRLRMEREAAEEAIRFLRGEPLRQPVPEEEYQSRMRCPESSG